ncbi:MAG: pilus assembly protein PilM [Planctomycetota bacterium]
MRKGSLGAWRQLGAKAGAPKPGKGAPIAVDFGASALKVFQLTSGEPHGIGAAAAIDTPDDLLDDPSARLAFQTQHLPGLIRGGGFKGKRAVCLIPACLTHTTHVQVPKGDAATVESSAKLAVATQLSCAPDALVVRHQEVGPAHESGKTEVITIAASRGVVGRLMSGLAAAKLEPVGMRTEAVALLRGFSTLKLTSEDDVCLYLDLGYSATKVIIAKGNRLLLARTIELGGRSLDEEIARHRKISIERSHRARMECSEFSGVERAPVATVTALAGDRTARVAESGLRMPPPRAEVPDRPKEVETRKSVSVVPDVGETLEMLGDEVAMCLRYHHSLFPDAPVTRAVLTGGESRQLMLCRTLAGVVRVPVQAGDPTRALVRSGKEPAIGVDPAAPMPGWSAVLGLGLCPTDL